MIKYILKCEKNHEFESWFSDSNEFEKLRNKKLLECIYCSSKKIGKSIMSPMVSGSKKLDFEKKTIRRSLSEKKLNYLKSENILKIILNMSEKTLAKKGERNLL